jgi:integrase/recombinase XerD
VSSVNGQNWEARRERILDTIAHAKNRALVQRYLNERQANGVKASTLSNDANALRGFCDYLGNRPLESVTRDDITGYVNQASRERVWRSVANDGHETETRRMVHLGPYTIMNRKYVLRDFFRWLRGTEEFPPEVRNLKVRKPTRDAIPTRDVLNKDDMLKLLQAHPDARDKAMLAVLYESGLRAGEFCALNISSVEFDQYGAVLTLPKGAPGLKTGARRVRLYESVPYLHRWVEDHPHKDDPKAALFYSMSRRAPGVRMSPNALWQFVNRAGKTAGLRKESHPHLFRHSAATERARMGWTETMMRAFFGWTRSSDMPARYVHLAGLDYERMDLERRGKLAHGETSKPALAPLVCRVCRNENLPTAMFCQQCRNPVSPAAEAELDARRASEIKEAAARILASQNPERPAMDVARMMREQIAEEVQRVLAERLSPQPVQPVPRRRPQTKRT